MPGEQRESLESSWATVSVLDTFVRPWSGCILLMILKLGLMLVIRRKRRVCNVNEIEGRVVEVLQKETETFDGS